MGDISSEIDHIFRTQNPSSCFFYALSDYPECKQWRSQVQYPREV